MTRFDTIVRLAPEFAEGWNARATAYYRAGLFGPSIYDIQMTLSLNPDHFGALIGLGLILEEIGDQEKFFFLMPKNRNTNLMKFLENEILLAHFLYGK